MKRMCIALLAYAVSASVAAADVRIDAVTPFPPNALRVQLSCSSCPELVHVLLPPVGTWVNGDSQALWGDLIDWRPVAGSVSSVTTLAVVKRRTIPLIPALVDVHWGHEIPGSPLAPPGSPPNLFVEGSSSCAVLHPNQRCEWTTAGCVMSNADSVYSQWCWQPSPAANVCQLKFQRCP